MHDCNIPYLLVAAMLPVMTHVTGGPCCRVMGYKHNISRNLDGTAACMQSTLRPTNWMTLECTKNNSTGPYKPMNIIRDSLLAKITRAQVASGIWSQLLQKWFPLQGERAHSS